MGTSPLLSRGEKRGANATSRLHSRGSKNKGEQNQNWSPTKGNKIRRGYLTHAFSGAKRRAEMLRHACILGDPKQRGPKSEVVPTKGEQNQKWLPEPCLVRGPKKGRNATSALHSRGSPTKGSKTKFGPRQRGTNSEKVPHPCLLTGPKEGRKCYVNPAFWGIPNKVEQNQMWLPHLCLLRGPKEGRKCYVTSTFSGIPNKGEQNQ